MNVHFRISAMVVVLICLARTYVHAHLEPVVIQQYQMVVQNYIQVILANYLLSLYPMNLCSNLLCKTTLLESGTPSYAQQLLDP